MAALVAPAQHPHTLPADRTGAMAHQQEAPPEVQLRSTQEPPSRKQTPPPHPTQASAALDASALTSVSLPSINTGKGKKGGPPKSPRAGPGYPTPFSHHDNVPVDSPMAGDGSRSPHVHFYSPYMIYPVASVPFQHGGQEPASPHAHAPGTLSPLMGSPVSTPTAMMFPQTPFGGVQQNPFSQYHHSQAYGYAADGTLSPHASGRVSYFHPLFNNFPFMGLQSLASVQPPPGVNLPRSISVCQPHGHHPRAGSITAGAGKDAAAGGVAAAGAGGGGAAPGGGKQGPPASSGLLMGQPSYSTVGMAPHIDTQVQLDSPDQAVSDANLLSGMFGAMHMHHYGGMPVYMSAMPDALAMQQLAEAQQQALLAQQLAGNPALAAAYMPADPSSPTAMMMHGMGLAGMQGGAAGVWPMAAGVLPMQLGGANLGLPGAGPGFDLWDLSSMYGLGALAQGMMPGMTGVHDMYGAPMFHSADAMAAMMGGGIGSPGVRRGRGNSQSPPKHGGGFPGFPQGVGAGAAGVRRPGPSPLGGTGGNPGLAAAVGKAGIRRSAAGGPPSMGAAGGDAKAGGVGAGVAAADGVPRLNARQRRTLRRARERVIKGLMEAGRLLLERKKGSTEAGTTHNSMGSVGDTTSSPTSTATPTTRDDKAAGLDPSPRSDGDKGDGSPPSTGQSSDQLAATNLYFQAAMQVAGGSHGPEAAANAHSVLSQIAAELEDLDIAELISTLGTRKEDGSVDDSLLRDLQIIQNLMGALQQGSAHAAAGASTAGPVAPLATMGVGPTVGISLAGLAGLAPANVAPQ